MRQLCCSWNLLICEMVIDEWLRLIQVRQPGKVYQLRLIIQAFVVAEIDSYVRQACK